MFAEPQKEHQWLQQLIGEWSYEHECIPGPGQPPMKATGIDTVRTLGGVWVLCESKGEMPGGGLAQTVMTLGYDPAKKRFVGSFVGSMFDFMWLYEGELKGNVLTLDTIGPDFTEPGKMVRYQDIIEQKDANHRTLTSQTLGADGKWVHFMTGHYRRTK